MRKVGLSLLFVLVVGILFTGCQQPGQDVAKLNQELEECKAKVEELEAQLAEMQAEMAAEEAEEEMEEGMEEGEMEEEVKVEKEAEQEEPAKPATGEKTKVKKVIK
ncbi:hypothetical protein JXI42_13480 [bacterium]|nr:hypothetical protein [bacterium]